MFDQTPINRLKGMSVYRPASGTNSDADAGGVRRLLADIAELAELQARLAASDAKCLAESIIRPFILGSLSLVLVLAALPIVILAGANFLIDQFDWSPALAQLSAAGVAILGAIALFALAIYKLKACGSPLSRSMAELGKNMDILREMLIGKSPVESHLEQVARRDRIT